MPFRSRMIGTGCVLTIAVLMLPGCRSAQGGSSQGSRWSFWPSRAPRRAVYRPQVQPDPNAGYSNGMLPTPNPQFDGRSPVQPAPAPIVVPAPEPSPGDGDSRSFPLPAPPRLQPQARNGASPPPPLPELPDLSETTPKLETTEKLPDVPSVNVEPEASADANSSSVPKQIPARMPQNAIPRIAERPARARQPVQLDVPESDQSPDPIPADPFLDEPGTQSVPQRDIAVPVPIEEEENLNLDPTPAPIPEADSAVETQSLEMDATEAINAVDQADAESDALPPHSA